MASEYQKEEIQNQIKKKLNEESVKLWLPPHTTQNGQKGEHPKELIDRYCLQLHLDVEQVSDAIETLRCHAVQKLAAKNKFQTTGLAVIKIKLAGKLPNQSPETMKGQIMNFEVGLDIQGQNLKQQIASQVGIDVHRLKLICRGKIIDDERSLQEQNIKNLCQMMCICLTESEVEARHEEEQASRVARTRQGAELLAARQEDEEDDSGSYYLQIADQTGKPLDLPPEERKALVLAMTLHEKGRAALKRKEYGEAVLVLLEADKEFRRCRSTILDAVDNYAILCLDIVWCHLCLKNINELPDAESRLQTCDDNFKKSYGPNLERLALIRGGTGLERVLFMRLHLLQAIVAFHQHHRQRAAQLLTRAEDELGKLTVDQDAMTQVMGMGFSQLEARLGLRVTEGNVQLAVSHIMKRREEKEERRNADRKEKRKKRLRRKFGKTANGSEMNVDLYDSLLSMGFPKGASVAALRQSNNDITQSIQILQEYPELLNLPDPEAEKVHITDDMIAQVAAMGFDFESARIALEKFRDVQKAIEELLQVGGEALEDWKTSASESGTSSESSSPTKSAEELAREKAAMDAIIPDIPADEDDHLDVTMEEEQHFLQEYKTLMRSLDT